MAKIWLKVDIAGTVGDDAWLVELSHHGAVEDSCFGIEKGTSGPCPHLPAAEHVEGEWCGAEIDVPDAVAKEVLEHYKTQDRILQANIEYYTVEHDFAVELEESGKIKSPITIWVKGL